MTEPILPAAAATAPDVFQSTIDAAAIAHLEAGLTSAFFTMLMTMGDRRGLAADLDAIQARYHDRMMRRAWALPVLLWSCLLGLVICAAFAFNGGIYYRGYRLDASFALFFLGGLALLPLLRRMQGYRLKPGYFNWILAPDRMLRQWTARRLAARGLQHARKLTPFDARYEIADGIATYYRVTPAGAAQVWQRALTGWQVAGPGFTLLFEDTKTFRYILFMHQPSARFDALLAQQGVLPRP